MKSFFQLLMLLIAAFGSLKAQTPADNIMMDKGRFCGALIYSNDHWDHYWEGTLKRTNGNLGTVTRQSVTPMFSLGLTRKINLLASLPYIWTQPSDGYFLGDKGIQDLGIGIKALLVNKHMGPGRLDLLTYAGYSTPLTNYNKDYLPFGLGLGAKEGVLRGIFQYQLDNGIYLSGASSYHLRGNIKIDRDYYYTDHPIYSNIVDMPDAIMYSLRLGAWIKKDLLNVNVSYDGMNTQGGFDIRRQDGPFPSNRMNNTMVNGFAHFYPRFAPGLSIFASYGRVLSGRNVGQSTAYAVGLAYQFGVWGARTEMAQ